MQHLSATLVHEPLGGGLCKQKLYVRLASQIHLRRDSVLIPSSALHAGSIYMVSSQYCFLLLADEGNIFLGD